jgi:hypothetical protein
MLRQKKERRYEDLGTVFRQDEILGGARGIE